MQAVCATDARLATGCLALGAGRVRERRASTVADNYCTLNGERGFWVFGTLTLNRILVILSLFIMKNVFKHFHIQFGRAINDIKSLRLTQVFNNCTQLIGNLHTLN